MKQMVDSEGRHWDWDYGTSSWVPTPQGVFADAPPAGEPVKTYSWHTTPEGTFHRTGTVWLNANGTAVPTPAALAFPILIPVAEYVAPDLRDRFNCPSCGDAVVLRHVVRRTGHEEVQCLDCERWAAVDG